MSLVNAAQKLAEKKMQEQSKRKDSGVEGESSPSNKTAASVKPSTYSDYNKPPQEQAGEFPGDYSDRLAEWEKNLSPEDKMKLRQKRAKENNINLDR